MKNRDLAIAAIKQEAEKKPDDKVSSGMIIITYKELAQRIDEKDKLVFKLFVKPYERQLKADKEFRMRIMNMLGILK